MPAKHLFLEEQKQNGIIILAPDMLQWPKLFHLCPQKKGQGVFIIISFTWLCSKDLFYKLMTEKTLCACTGTGNGLEQPIETPEVLWWKHFHIRC